VASNPNRRWPDRIARTADGRLWIIQREEAQRQRLYWLKSNGLENIQIPDFSADLNITKILEDREGNLWIGCTTGLWQLTPKRLRVYSRHDGLRSDDVQAVAGSIDGSVWVGTRQG